MFCGVIGLLSIFIHFNCDLCLSSHSLRAAGQSNNPFSVKPSYTFWAPWIGPHTRRSSFLYNTEYRKCTNLSNGDGEQDEVSMSQPQSLSEEDIVEMMYFSQVFKFYLANVW